MKTKLTVVPIAFLGVIAELAYAHTELAGSEPPADAVIETAPKEIMLHFSAPVRLTALAVQKQGQAKQSLGPLPADASEHFLVAAPSLSEGEYKVSWRALSEDTHVVTGEFAFTVGAGGTPGEPIPNAEPANHAHTEHSAHQ